MEALKLDKSLHASGRVSMLRGVSDSTTLLGFFHSKHSIAVAAKPPVSGFPANFLGVAIEGPSREGFLFYPVYHFSNGASDFARNTRELPHIMPDGKSHQWTLKYTPPIGSRPGQLHATLGKSAGSIEVVTIPNGPVEFDRFGIVTTWIDGNSQQVYFDDLTFTCRQ